MTANPRRANGYRRDQVRARVLREEHDCWLCDKPVDKTLGNILGKHGAKCTNPECPGCSPHPMRAEVDEIIPVSLGGDPLDRRNCHLAHRICNIRRGNGTRTRQAIATVKKVREW